MVLPLLIGAGVAGVGVAGYSIGKGIEDFFKPKPVDTGSKKEGGLSMSPFTTYSPQRTEGARSLQYSPQTTSYWNPIDARQLVSYQNYNPQVSYSPQIQIDSPQAVAQSKKEFSATSTANQDPRSQLSNQPYFPMSSSPNLTAPTTVPSSSNDFLGGLLSGGLGTVLLIGGGAIIAWQVLKK